MCVEYSHMPIDQKMRFAEESSNGNNITNSKGVMEDETLCSLNARCEYSGPGKYRCVCKEGYIGDGKQFCRRKLWIKLYLNI